MELDRNPFDSQKKVKKVNKNKRLFFWGGIVVLITTLPYLLGFFVQNEKIVFSGFLFGVEDGNSYIAKMLLGSAGDWLFRSPYSAIDQGGLFAFFPYLLIGKLAGGPGLHEQLIAVFQLFRIAGVFFLVYVYLHFLGLFFEDYKNIKLGMVLILFGAGWDWIILFFGVDRLPISFYSPETFGFLSLFGLPHLCFSRGFMLLGMIELFHWDFSNTGRPFFRTGIFFFAAAIFQPLNLVIAYIVFAIWWLVLLFRKKFAFRINLFLKQSMAILISLPAFVYYFWIVNVDPFMKQWTAQNILPSPPIIDYLFAFGPLFTALLLEVFFFRTVKELFSDEKKIILFLWVILSFVLVYLPINVQRRLMDGVWLANIILLLPTLKKINSRVLKWVIVGSMMITPVFLISGAMVSVLNPREPQFQSVARVAVYKELAKIAEDNAVILAPFEISNEIPAFGKLRVVTGHGPESVNKQQIDRFLTNFIRMR